MFNGRKHTLLASRSWLFCQFLRNVCDSRMFNFYSEEIILLQIRNSGFCSRGKRKRGEENEKIVVFVAFLFRIEIRKSR